MGFWIGTIGLIGIGIFLCIWLIKQLRVEIEKEKKRKKQV